MILFKEFQWIIVCLTIDLTIARLNYSTISCLQGPSYWCLNETTEALCHFQNQSIGLCGYSNKRCQIKTGKKLIIMMLK